MTTAEGPPLRECEVCGAMSALNFCAACGCEQLDQVEIEEVGR